MMARRSAVRSGRDTAVVEEAAPPGRALGSTGDPWALPDNDQGGGRRRSGGRWGGSGGRWWIWVGRAVLWALILVILVNGIRAPFERFTTKESATGGTQKPSKSGTQFPSSQAGAFALQFATTYLNYDQKTAAARETQLRTFLPEGADGQFGWNGVGVLQVQSVQVAGVDAKDDNNGVVTVLARSQDKWLRLAVPVFAKNGALVIPARPALLPPPTKAQLPTQGVRDRDAALETELQTVLHTFFQAYARSDQATLSRFSDGTSIPGLGDSVNFVQVRSVVAPRGEAKERTVMATVAWQIPGAAAGGELEQTYELALVKKGTSWYVRDIRGTTEPGGS
ncbi:conjugal transfer protein [Spirillospora sp. CA-294931]|uniref:conjugal transfer protein n=1 Tax=Spirillospora sp. CA-294931 TaxID=3240042 RepID=UPI003D8CA02A